MERKSLLERQAKYSVDTFNSFHSLFTLFFQLPGMSVSWILLSSFSKYAPAVFFFLTAGYACHSGKKKKKKKKSMQQRLKDGKKPIALLILILSSPPRR